MLAHMGVCVSLGTTRNTIKSLRSHANARLHNLPPGNMIYDNIDTDFKVAQPTTGHQGLHMSAMAATFAPYVRVPMGDLKVTKELYEKSPFNKDLSPTDPKIYKPTASHILPGPKIISTSNNLDALLRAFAWHICAILIYHMKGFENYKSNLSLPEEVDKLPVEQTTQYLANAINMDEGQNDGNWEVLKNLLQQVNPQHPTHKVNTDCSCYSKTLMRIPWKTM